MRAGRAFEIVVAEVAKAMDSESVVLDGQWVVGPDGRRDRDVLIESKIGERLVKTLIECKDYNPATTGPVGIEKVDALESKRRDLSVDAALICSNAGFTLPARRKAARVGIGLFSVMKMGDDRLRFQVRQELYIRRLDVIRFGVKLRGESGDIDLCGSPLEEVKYRALRVMDWCTSRITCVLGANPITNGTFVLRHDFIAAIDIDTAIGEVRATGVDVIFEVSGDWFVQAVEMDSTAAIYNWLSRRVVLTPGEVSLHLRDVEFDGGKLVDCAPDWVLNQSCEMQHGETALSVVNIGGLGAGLSADESLEFSQLFIQEHIDLKVTGLPEAAIRSRNS